MPLGIRNDPEEPLDSCARDIACGCARLVRLARCDRRTDAGYCSAAGTGGRAGANAAAEAAARRHHPVAAGGACWRAGRSGSTCDPGCQPQSRRIECRTKSRRVAPKGASSRCVGTHGPRITRHATHRVGGWPRPRAPGKGASSTRGRSRIEGGTRLHRNPFSKTPTCRLG